MNPLPSCTICKFLSVRKCHGKALQNVETEIFKSATLRDNWLLLFIFVSSICDIKFDELSLPFSKDWFFDLTSLIWLSKSSSFLGDEIDCGIIKYL